MKLDDVAAAGALVQAVDVLADDVMELAAVHQLNQRHVALGRHSFLNSRAEVLLWSRHDLVAGFLRGLDVSKDRLVTARPTRSSRWLLVPSLPASRSGCTCFPPMGAGSFTTARSPGQVNSTIRPSPWRAP